MNYILTNTHLLRPILCNLIPNIKLQAQNKWPIRRLESEHFLLFSCPTVLSSWPVLYTHMYMPVMLLIRKNIDATSLQVLLTLSLGIFILFFCTGLVIVVSLQISLYDGATLKIQNHVRKACYNSYVCKKNY